MPYYLGARSRAELLDVHPRLVEVVERAIVITECDFCVLDGMRNYYEQCQLVEKGASTTLHSKHLCQPDGYAHAVDLVPWINGRARWEWGPIYVVARAVQHVAKELGVALRWGGVWDRDLAELDDIERELEAYVDRRRAAGLRVFLDGPHFELIEPV